MREEKIKGDRTRKTDGKEKEDREEEETPKVQFVLQVMVNGSYL